MPQNVQTVVMLDASSIDLNTDMLTSEDGPEVMHIEYEEITTGENKEDTNVITLNKCVACGAKV